MKTQQAIDDYLTQNRRYVLLIKLLYLYILKKQLYEHKQQLFQKP